MRSFVLAALSLIALASCHLRTDAPADAPTGVQVTAGDGLVVVSWESLPDLTYWIFFSAGASVGVGNPGSIAVRNVISPRVIGNLTNDVPFAFIVNATHADSPAGPSSIPIVKKPKLAGDTDTWTSGPAIVVPPPAPPAPPQNLKSAAFNGSRFVVVGDAATIFAGDFNYTSGFLTFPGPPGVTAWLPPVLPLPVGATVNLNSVIFNGGFVAMGTASAPSSSSPIISSADGINWVANTPVPAAGMNALGFGFVSGISPTHVAVGDLGRIFRSNDLVTWTEATLGTNNNTLNSVSFLNGSFFATGAGGTLLTSGDGITWTALNSNTPPTTTLRSVTFTPLGSGIHYVAVGDGGVVTTSTDGGVNNWSAITLAGAPDLRSVTVGGANGARFLAVGSGGVVAYSDDGVTWVPASAGSANLAKVVFVPGMYLAVGDAGANAVSR